MKQINNYIQEKLHITKNFVNDDTFDNVDDMLKYLKENGVEATYKYGGDLKYYYLDLNTEYPYIVIAYPDKEYDTVLYPNCFIIDSSQHTDNKIIPVRLRRSKYDAYDAVKEGADFIKEQIFSTNNVKNTAFALTYNNADILIRLLHEKHR